MATQFPVSYSAQAAMYSNGTASGNEAGTYYIQGGPSDAPGQVVQGDLRVTGNLRVDGTDLTIGALTAGSITTTGQLNAGSTTVAALTSTGNSALTGTASLTVGGDLTVERNVSFTGPGTILQNNLTVLGGTSLANVGVGQIVATSLSATAPFNVGVGNSQATMTIAGWRIVWGCHTVGNNADTGPIPFLNAAGNPTPFTTAPMMVCSAQQFSTHGFFDGTVTAAGITNLHGTTIGGSGYQTNVWYICIGQA